MNRRILLVNGIEGVPNYTIDQLKIKKHEYALVIPVLNENGRILEQLKKIDELNPEVDVIIADGGSIDGSTSPLKLEKLNVSALLIKTGPGKLSAQLRMAFHYCLQSGYSGIITMDGNGKDGVEGIARIIGALNNGYEFVQGSRYIKGGKAKNIPIFRAASIKLIHAPITSLASRFRFTDSTNGFRGFDISILTADKLAPFSSIFDKYEFLAYAPIRAGKLRLKIVEIPVSREYPLNGKIPTKIKGLKSHFDLLKVLIKASLGFYDPGKRDNFLHD